MEWRETAIGRKRGVRRFVRKGRNSVLRFLRIPQHRLIAHSLVLSVLVSFGAILFVYALELSQRIFLGGLAGYRAPGLPNEGGVLAQVVGGNGLWLIPLATTLGGLIAGWVIYRFAPEAEGHGTDAAIRAFHRTAGVLRLRIAPVKAIASAITIGSGGAAGREGPVALIGASIGSAYADATKLPESERRLLLLVGLAAGIAAVFRTPLGAALIAIEILYRGMEFEAAALLYTMLASVAAYAVTGLFLGWEALFRFPEGIVTPSVFAYGWYAMLGIAAGVAATALPVIFYRIREFFEALPGPAHLKPAIGGFAVGLIALALPQVLGGGYGWIQMAMYGQLTLGLMLLLAVAKTIAFSLTIGSGGSGGVFAPSLFVGAMIGGVLGTLLDQPIAAFIVVGMAAVFAGAAHVPIAALIMVTEMTGSYQLLVPAALALMLSFLTQVTLSAPLRFKGLYQAQVFSRGDSPAHHADHLRIALRILRDREVALPTDVGRIDLVSLMMAGIPVDLQDGRRLSVATVAPHTWLEGKEIRELGLHTEEVNILTIIRGEHMAAARPETRLEPHDRLLCLTSASGWEQLGPHVQAGWSERAGGWGGGAEAGGGR
jgi:chloride channel protein, CIC family